MSLLPERVCRLMVVLLCLAYCAGAAMVRPSLMPDPAYGLLVLKSGQAGAPWNHLIEPDDDHIASSRLSFNAAFSPGQHMLPGALMTLGLSMGASIGVVSIAASLIGLAGWLWLFRTLRFSVASGVAACAVIAASRGFNYSFLGYMGSEVLAFAAFPFLAGVALRVMESSWFPVYAAVGIFAAFAAKNSLPIFFAAWIGALVLLTLHREGLTRPNLLRAAATVVAILASMAVIQIGYTSRGWNALVYQPDASAPLVLYLVPWAMPVLAATSWDDVFSWVFSHPSGAMLPFAYKSSLVLIGAIAIGSVSAAGVAVARARKDEPTTLLLLYSVIVLTGLTGLLVTGAAANLDLSRHYRIVGYVWLPLIASVALSSRRAVAAVLVLVLAVPAVYGVASFRANWRRHYASRASQSPRVQITHLQLSERLVQALAILDRELPSASLVVTAVPMYALEFERTRVFGTSAITDHLERVAPRHGKVSNLLLFTELEGMSEERRAAWLATFPAYQQWEWHDLDAHRFYVPVGQPVNRDWLRAHLAASADH